MSFSSTFITQYEVAFTELVRLSYVGAQKIVDGEDSSVEDKRAERMFICLQALDSTGLSAAQIESLEYCLRRLNHSLAVPTITALVTVTPPAEEAEAIEVVLFGGNFGFDGGDMAMGLSLSTLVLGGGDFAFDGGALGITLNSSVSLAGGDFSFNGGDLTITYTPVGDPYILEMELAEAIAGTPTWVTKFDMESSPYTQDTLTCTGNGATDTGELTESGNIVCTVYKTSNSGVAEDAGTVEFFLNAVSQDSQNFIASDNVGVGFPKTYIFTGLSPGDILKAFVTEG